MDTRNQKFEAESQGRPSLGWTLNLACLSLSLVGSTALGGNTGGTRNSLTPLTNVLACPGDNVTFSTVASGPTPYRFEWWRNAVILPGKTNSSLTISNVSATNAGTYSV